PAVSGELRKGMFSNKSELEMRLFVEPNCFLEVGGKLGLVHVHLLKVDTKKVRGILCDD
ncbi:MAG: hypothetical protein Q9222_005575, partial [Ikaeria aurantiellina]